MERNRPWGGVPPLLGRGGNLRVRQCKVNRPGSTYYTRGLPEDGCLGFGSQYVEVGKDLPVELNSAIEPVRDKVGINNGSLDATVPRFIPGEAPGPVPEPGLT